MAHLFLFGRQAALPMLKLSITIERVLKMSLLQTPVHPGEVLKELYLEPLNVSSIELARPFAGATHPDRKVG